jgi:hypothetical protein
MQPDACGKNTPCLPAAPKVEASATPMHHDSSLRDVSPSRHIQKLLLSPPPHLLCAAPAGCAAAQKSAKTVPNPIGCDCSDVEVRNDFDGPRSEYTCLQQVEYGNCEQDFMLHTIKEIPEGGWPAGGAGGQHAGAMCGSQSRVAVASLKPGWSSPYTQWQQSVAVSCSWYAPYISSGCQLLNVQLHPCMPLPAVAAALPLPAVTAALPWPAVTAALLCL